MPCPPASTTSAIRAPPPHIRIAPCRGVARSLGPRPSRRCQSPRPIAAPHRPITPCRCHYSSTGPRAGPRWANPRRHLRQPKNGRGRVPVRRGGAPGPGGAAGGGQEAQVAAQGQGRAGEAAQGAATEATARAPRCLGDPGAAADRSSRRRSNWATCWRRPRKTSSAWASRGRPSPTSWAATACCSTRTRCAAARRSQAPIVAPRAAAEPDRGPPQDVKLYTGRCLAHLLRIYVPDSPFDDETLEARDAEPPRALEPAAIVRLERAWRLAVAGRPAGSPPALGSPARSPSPTPSPLPPQEVFRLQLWCFKRLQQAQAPTFNLCTSILEVTAQVRAAAALPRCVRPLPARRSARPRCPPAYLRTPPAPGEEPHPAAGPGQGGAGAAVLRRPAGQRQVGSRAGCCAADTCGRARRAAQPQAPLAAAGAPICQLPALTPALPAPAAPALQRGEPAQRGAAHGRRAPPATQLSCCRPRACCRCTLQFSRCSTGCCSAPPAAVRRWDGAARSRPGRR